MRFAGVKLRALLLSRGRREVDLVDARVLERLGISPKFFLKYLNHLVHGKTVPRADDPKLRAIAARLRVPVKFFVDDAEWDAASLADQDRRALRSLRALFEWYFKHAGPESAHKYLGLDFDALRRQSRILEGMTLTVGQEPLIQAFVGMDHEEGKFDREFATLERLASRNRGVRTKILTYVWDVPETERRAGRKFPALELAGTEFELAFGDDLAPGVRYSVEAGKRRRLTIKSGVDDYRLAYILAREVAKVLIPIPDVEPDWPCPIESYETAKSHVLTNRCAAALLLPREIMRPRLKRILLDFSDETVERACRELGCAAETLLLRIVQIHPREAHFIRIDASGPEGPFLLRKLYCGNGLPVRHRYASTGPFPATWGVMKSLKRFFDAGSAASRHVQITRMSDDDIFVCMSVTHPAFEEGAKALCIGYRLEEFKRLYGGLPRVSEKRIAVDASPGDVDWTLLDRLEREARSRRAPRALATEFR